MLTCEAAILAVACEPVCPVEVRSPLSPGHWTVILQEVIITESDLLTLLHVPDQDDGDAPGPGLLLPGHSVVCVAAARVIYSGCCEEHSTSHVTDTGHGAFLILKLETVGAQNTWKTSGKNQA